MSNVTYGFRTAVDGYSDVGARSMRLSITALPTLANVFVQVTPISGSPYLVALTALGVSDFPHARGLTIIVEPYYNDGYSAGLLAGAISAFRGDGSTLGQVAVNDAINVVDNADFAKDEVGSAGNNALFGDAGDNRLIGLDGDDVLAGGAGADRLDGGNGVDTANYSSSDAAVQVTIGGSGHGGDAEGDTLISIEAIIGSAFDDALTGGTGDDELHGEAGNDTLLGGNGDDLLDGGDGDDLLDGGAGSDTLRGGGAGVDIQRGGAGDDAIVVDRASDILAGEVYDGGADDDTLYLNFDFDGDLSAATLTGIEEINQTYYVHDTRLTAAQLDAVMRVSGVSFTLTTGGSVSMAGATLATETIALADAHTVLDLSGATATRLLTVAGGSAGDVVTGTAGADTLLGNGGNDRLAGGDGDDRLDGGTGADRLTGGAGDDTYVLDDIGDRAIEVAGGGYDRVESAVSYRLGTGIEAATLTGTAASSATGNTLDNDLAGNESANRLDGGNGSDTLAGMGGNDVLIGGGGDDTIQGGDGNDTITGGARVDTLGGGAGADLFRFVAGDTGRDIAHADRILDFSHDEGDRIGLGQVDGDGVDAGFQPFRFIGTAAFSGSAGELRIGTAAGDTLLLGDTDGNGAADFVLRFAGAVTITAQDLLLGHAGAALVG